MAENLRLSRGELPKLLLLTWTMFWLMGPLMIRAIQVSIKERRLLRAAKARENGKN